MFKPPKRDWTGKPSAGMEVAEVGERGAAAMVAEDDDDMEILPDITQEQFPSDMSMY